MGAGLLGLCAAVLVGISACGAENTVQAPPDESPSATDQSRAGAGSSADRREQDRQPDSTGQPGDVKPEPDGSAGSPDGSETQPVKKARCPDDAANCASASGQIVFVEAVDPDGDGDAHFVLVSTDSITAPGISVIDVRVDLRPEPLPGIGDSISASGPVFPGSYGQFQIQADVLNVARG